MVPRETRGERKISVEDRRKEERGTVEKEKGQGVRGENKWWEGEKRGQGRGKCEMERGEERRERGGRGRQRRR